MNLFIIIILMLIYLQNLKTVYMRRVQKFHGRFTRDLENYELLVPHRTTETGDFLSFYLNSFFTHDYKSRRRRDDSDSAEDKIHYKLFFNGADHVIELAPNHGFVSPNLISEYHYPGSEETLTTRHIKKPLPAMCHYTGSVRDHDNSNAALSLCDGLMGYLKTDNGIFFIEPAEGHGPNEFGHHLHVIHRQNDVFKNKKEVGKSFHFTTVNEGDHAEDYEDDRHDDDDDDEVDDGRFHFHINLDDHRNGRASNCNSCRSYTDESVNGYRRDAGRNVEDDGGDKDEDDDDDDDGDDDEVEANAGGWGGGVRGDHANGQCESCNWNEGWAKAFQNLYEGKMATQYANRNKPTLEISDDMKREINNAHKFIEVLVVADKKFLDYHRDKDYENYILTIMNMVSDFYHDCSIGHQMDVVVVRIIYLDKEIEALDVDISPDAHKTIDSFCKWQCDINPKDIEHPHHHDTAVLLTRHDICVDESNCNLLGLAHLASACSPKDSCSINEDTGLLLGVVVAHEIGHIVGCDHDDKSSSGCEAKVDKSFYHVMSPYVSLATTKWSSCSKKFISELFKNNLGQCLLDEPKESPYKELDMLPGSIYDVDYQCRLLFSASSAHCPQDESEFCEKLFCRVDDKTCRSSGDPPADGTHCGFNKWCFRRRCVGIGARAMASKSGEWEEWGPYCECSRTCGGGIQVSTRECKNPENGGAYCVGDRRRLKICNTQPCPLCDKSFRSQQCAEFNNVKHHNKLYKWEPFLLPNVDSDANCALYCINNEGAYSKLQPRVKDGTLCEIGTNNMCVGGLCKKVGCDWLFDSDAVEDKCGICNGNGQGCRHKNSTYTKICNGYKMVKKLPKGAKNVQITELGCSDNMIAIGCKNGNKMFLNKDFKQDCDGAKELNGNVAMYSHIKNNREHLVIPGPLTKPLYFFIAFVKEENVGYHYEYYTIKKNCPRAGNVPPGAYRWDFVEFSHCSARCGGGEAISHPVCILDGEGEVGPQFCENLIKPEPKIKVCNVRECRISWHVGEWGKCCGCVHKAGSQRRKVWCAKESSHWEEHDILEENVACAKAEGPKPCAKQLCICKCAEGTCPARRKRTFTPSAKKPADFTAHDFIKLFRSIDTMLDKEPRKTPTPHNCPPDNDVSRIKKCGTNKGTTISDALDVEHLQSIDAPLKRKSTANLSDAAFEKLDETLSGRIDLSHARTCHGESARDKLFGKNIGKKDKHKANSRK